MATAEMISPRLAPRELKAVLGEAAEVAILDVREEGVFARGHLLLASSAPLSRLELRIGPLVPRLATRIVLCDDGERLAQRAAQVLRGIGYRDLSVLAGGLAAWRKAGYEVYSGMHVPSKAFGEHVEQRDGTPRIGAAELKAKRDAGDDLVVLDSRPMSEYRVMNIPGAHDCPGAELVYRVHQAAPRPETLVVVNCAGRTRSIIGAQSLINAGVPNRVAALKNGTMGWHLAGFELEHGSRRAVAAPQGEALARAKAAAARVAQHFGVKRVPLGELERMRADQARTTYVFDVRSPEEYAAGHLRGSVSAPGGQLVQATDAYAAVRNARIALLDGDGVRATMTASWLLQMGWVDVYTIKGALEGALETEAPASAQAPDSAPSRSQAPDCARVKPRALGEMQKAENVEILDFGSSMEYRAAHIPGAGFAIRSRLEGHLERLQAASSIVCTSPGGVLAGYAAADLAALLGRPVHALEGGTAAWRAAGLPLERGATRMLEPPEDVYYRPYDRAGQVEAAMRDYLQWEVALLERVRRDPDCRFRDL